VCVFCVFLENDKMDLRCQIKLDKITDKLATTWQNFALVGLQLKLASRIRQLVLWKWFVMFQIGVGFFRH